MKHLHKMSRTLSGILFLTVMLMIAYFEFRYYRGIDENSSQCLTQNWVDENGDFFPLNGFSPEIANAQHPKKIFYNSDSFAQNEILLFCSRNMYVNVYLNDIPVYMDEPVHDAVYGTSPGIRWHMAVIPASDSAQTICIESSNVYENTNGLIDNIYLGAPADVFQSVIIKHFFAFFISILFILFGLALCGFFIYFMRKNRTGAEFVYLGTASVFAGLWSACESYLLSLFFGNSEFFHLVSYLCLISIPPAFGLIASCKLHGKAKHFSHFYVLFSCGNAIITSLLHFSGYREFHYTLTITHVLLFAFITVSFLLLRNYHVHGRYEKKDVIHIIGFSIIIFSVFTAILRYYWGNSSDFSFYFRLAIIGFILCMMIYQMLSLIDMIKNDAQADVIHKLAITDTLTQLYNRTAFLENEHLYTADGFATVGVIQFDINNLKTINDTLGHEKGDQLIRLTAEGIYTAFHHVGDCYRMGGDEFLVILTKKHPKSDYHHGMPVLLDFFQENRLFEDMPAASVCAEVAHGFVYDTSLSLEQVLHLADQKMYQNKKELKNRS